MSKRSTTPKPLTPFDEDHPMPCFKYCDVEDKWIHENKESLPTLRKLFCTSGTHQAVHLLCSTLDAMPCYHPRDRPSGFTPNMLVEYLVDQAPQSITETQLVLNMLVLHVQGMEYANRLKNSKYMDQVKVYTSAVERLNKAYAKQATVFAKLRGKVGNVYLQQVNVNEGGQALVKQGA
jgi:hypothetical protein